MANAGVSGSFGAAKGSWSDVVRLRQVCQDDETVAIGMLTDPSSTLERIGLDIAFDEDGEHPRCLSEILENLSISARSDVLQPLLQPARVAADDFDNFHDPGWEDPAIVLAVNVAVAVNVGGFVNAALVVNVGVFANIATGTNVFTVVGGQEVPSVSADATGRNIQLTTEFLEGELARHFRGRNLSENRQRTLMHFVMDRYRTEVESLDVEPQEFKFSYRGQPFAVSVNKGPAGDLMIQGGKLLN